MRPLLRAFAYTSAAVSASVAFVAAGRVTPDRLTTSDVSGWLNRVDPVDALVELARWIGLGLSTYVALVGVLALLGELAGLVSLFPLQRVLNRLTSAVALPALRRRLIELGAAATITAASLPSLAFAAAPAPMAVAAAPLTPAHGHSVPLGAQYEGFDLPATPSPPTIDDEIHIVERGDTLWAIITQHYGHCDRALLDIVVAANPIIRDPNLILIGWKIALPPGEVPPPPPAVVPRGDATWAGVTVQAGDTLRDIVERHYGLATEELVWAVIDANPSIDDPNLIYPGQVLTLPPRGDGVGAPTPAPDISIEPLSPPSSVPTPLPVTATPTTTPRPEVDESATLPATTAEVAYELVDPIPAPDRADESAVEGDDVAHPPVAQVVGWSGGAALAAAILGLATRRRRRLPPKERVRRPNRRAAHVGVALRVTENLMTVEWASLALRELATRLRPVPGHPSPVPRLLRLAGDDIELVWDSPAPDVLEPWISPDGGWSWTLRRPDDFDVRGTPHPCPAFVTIGRRDGADVLLNLESCGAIAVVGESTGVDDLVRSLCVELGASAFADSPTVLVVGADAAPPGQPDHVRLATGEEAVGWMRDRSESSSALLSSRRLTSLFSLRARSQPRDGHEPLIVVVDEDAVDGEQLGQLVDLANGDMGAVVVVRGDHPSVCWRLRLHDSSVVIEPLGLELEAVGLSAEVGRVLDEIVPPPEDDMNEADATDSVPGELVHADLAPLLLQAVDLSLDPVDEDFDVELKVLGQVRAIGAKQALTPTELHLAIYLAFHRSGENADTISTMIWPDGATPKTLTNAMASLRRKLGTGSDGQMLFPLGRDNQYTYRLSDRVATDWDRFVALARRAESADPDVATALLARAIDLIDGPPFRASAGYSWAYGEGIATAIVEGIKQTAERLIVAYTDAGDHRRAADVGLRSLCALDSLLDAVDIVESAAASLDAIGSPSQAAQLRARLSAALD